MQVGTVLEDGRKLDNVEVLKSREFPLPYIGVRRFFVPDERRMRYYEERMLSATSLLQFLRMHVGELYEDLGCPMRAYLDYNLEIYVHPASLMSMVQGKMLHDSMIPSLEEVRKEMQVEGELYGVHVAGDVDFYDEEKGIVYDLKTAKSLYMIPKPEHLAQLYIYSQLLLQNEHPVHYATLFYISHGEMSVMQFPYLPRVDAYSMADVERDLRVRAPPSIDVEPRFENAREAVGKTLQYNYRSGEFEMRDATWRCGYCPFRRYCPYAYENMRELLNSMFRKSVPRFAESFVNRVKYAGVKREDEFLMPEEELLPILEEMFGNKVDVVLEEIARKRKVMKMEFTPMSEVRW